MYSICDTEHAQDSVNVALNTNGTADDETQKSEENAPNTDGTADDTKNVDRESEEEKAAKALMEFKVKKNDELPALIKLKMVLDDLNISKLSELPELPELGSIPSEVQIPLIEEAQESA